MGNYNRPPDLADQIGRTRRRVSALATPRTTNGVLTSGGSWGVENLAIYRVGDIAVLEGYIDDPAGIPTGTTLTELPSALRPRHGVEVPVSIVANLSQTVGFIVIDQNFGAVSLWYGGAGTITTMSVNLAFRKR